MAINLTGLPAVGVSEVHLWGDEIPDPLFENFDVGKASVPFSTPNQFFSAGNPETARFRPARAQADIGDFRFESSQDFLSHP